MLGFVASFLAVGAVGFRLRVIAGAGARAGTADDGRVLDDAASRAAGLGLLGAIVSLVLFLTRLPGQAERQHLTVGAFLASNPRADVQVLALIAAVAGLALAARRIGWGWALAAIGVVVGPLSALFFGQWNRVVVPVHRLAAGMWIGTLFMLVVVGLSTVLRSALPSERRGTLVADLVNAFSPLALGSAAVLAVFGVITSWQHLHTLEALWTTPYGITLIVKLLLVGCVLALGAWNWRRQKPRLGPEAGVARLRRTASSELAVAGLVLATTAILVSVPSPKRPGADGGPGAPAPGEARPDSGAGPAPGRPPAPPAGR